MHLYIRTLVLCSPMGYTRGMTSSDKTSALDWAISKIDAATTRDEILRLQRWAYERARGSNGRKARLDDAVSAALARIG